MVEFSDLSKEKVKIRGLVRIAGWIFAVWGGFAGIAGLYHSFIGEPEANYYSMKPWEFVTQEQWMRWSGFEITYGLACVAVGFLCFEYSKRLPEYIERDRDESKSFFD